MQSYWIGVGLTAAYSMLRSWSTVFHERMLKKCNDTPMFVQQMYEEFWTIAITLALCPVIGLWKPEQGALFSNGFFVGWTNPFIFCLLLTKTARSWLNTATKKLMSAITKKLCATCAHCLLYFAMLVHACPNNLKHFFCLDGLGDLSWQVALAAIGLCGMVITYSIEKNHLKSSKGKQKRAKSSMTVSSDQ